MVFKKTSLITYRWKYHNFLRWHVSHLFPILITQKILLFMGPTNWLCATFTSSLFPSTPNTQTHWTQWKGMKKKKKKKKPNPETQCEKERKEEKKMKITRIDPAWKGKKRRRRRPDLTTYMLWVPQIYVYLPKWHHNSISITQKHLKVVFSFHNLSLKNQRIE